MSKNRGLDSLAGRLGGISKQDAGSDDGAAAQGHHYNSGRLGIVSADETDQEELAQQAPRAERSVDKGGLQPTSMPDEPVAPDGSATAEESRGTGPDSESEAVVVRVEQATSDDSAEHAVSVNVSVAESESDGDDSSFPTGSADDLPSQTVAISESSSAREQETDVSETVQTADKPFRMGESSNARHNGSRGKTAQFNVEVFSSGKRKSWLPAAAILVTVGTVVWFVWQRTENRLQTLQAAAPAAASLLPQNHDTTDLGSADITPANPVNESESTQGVLGAKWMSDVSRSFIAWVGKEASTAMAVGSENAGVDTSETQPSTHRETVGETADETAGDTADETALPVRYRECPTGIVLNSVMLSKQGPLACINGSFVKVGSVIRGARVIKINADSVIMELNGERFEVLLGQ